jgi:preprotein translocase subunit SecA
MSNNPSFDVEQIMPVLASMGMAPDQLGEDKMAKLMELAQAIQNPESMDSEAASSLFRDIGIGFKPPKTNRSDKKTKVCRNDPCPCGSGKKSKKCCLEY